ncbi:RraA family protein [Alkalibacterium kapii]|uniref:Putative 4-hydroxy-4-methyl-2-oxoglutarate aldolase n=1 Tax=Alkalibacterium kapii TaxID=426704 RepID=A0A511AVE6_9LACT|nr:RraA family protein [Alkalibacterium kapii]GEK92170.1 diguanylate cyclase [Alkalibacterium kapii]
MINNIEKEIIEEYKKLDTCTISDAFDQLNIGQGGFISPKPMVKNTKICGQVYTVRYLPMQEYNKNFGTFLDDIPKGRVAVIDNNGRLDGSVWGDTMALFAQKQGVAGAVLNGVYRDVEPINELGFPVFAKGTSTKSGKNLVAVDAVNVPIQIDDVRIDPDDLIFGDESGVMVIPYQHVETVLKEAKRLKDKDQHFIDNLESGMPYKDAKQN